ncbi:hypothetical protein BH09BAC6_BH09BAC6_26160 [soil metagenome]|jgi:hypothetical protein
MATITAEPAYWTAPQKVLLRFFLAFFLLYVFFNPNGVIPYTDNISEFLLKPFHLIIPWLAAHMLGMAKPVTIFTNGSGDTTYDYLIMLFITVISAIVTLVWSIADKKARNYNKLFYWLTVVVRYYVAITMITYGTIKIIKLQFPSPSLGRLIEPFGNASPMGLAWTYMGYSAGFNIFTGLGELTCGLLLFFRKTSLLGAVLGLVVTGNIMAVNYGFDVPVKLLSTMLVVMCLFILIRDMRRLINFFLLNRDALPSNLSAHRFKARWKNITLGVIKYVLVAYTVVFGFYSAVQTSKEYGDKAKKPPLYGIYNVESFVRNRDTLPPLTTDTIRWNKMVINFAGNVQVKLMNDSMKFYSFVPDTVKHKVVVHTFADTLHKYQFTYTLQKPDVMLLSGKWKQDSLHIRLRRLDHTKFLLLRRGFRWISEYPYNR